MKTIVIGITGGSGSGKTTVVKKILDFFPGNEVAVISQDAYYRDNSHLSLEERRKINFDHPNSIEFELLVKHIEALKKDKPLRSLLTIMLPLHANKKQQELNRGTLLLWKGFFYLQMHKYAIFATSKCM